jgi:YVTN family beta-propeller protein
MGDRRRTIWVIRVAMIAIVASSCGGGGSRSQQSSASASDGAAVATITLPAVLDVTWLAADATSVWVHGKETVIHVDASTNAILVQIRTPSIAYGYMASGEGAVWQADFGRDVVLRIDPETEAVVAQIEVGAAPEGVGTTAGAVWVANHHDGTVSRIDPGTNVVVATIDVGPAGSNGPLELAAGQTGVWVHVPNLGTVVHIDPITNAVIGSVAVDGVPAVDGNAVWITDPAGSAVVRVDATSHAVAATIPIVPVNEELSFGGVAAGLGSVWMSTTDGLYRIDASIDGLLRSIESNWETSR